MAVFVLRPAALPAAPPVKAAAEFRMPTQAEEIRAVLDKTPLFSYLEEPILESLVSKFEIISYDLGDTIIQSGDPGDSFYVIFNG
ncbi:MAG TPA: hypothetical protein DDZ83_14655, partial [Nitrospinae bacterium]|nr:hypothetical protein [Nitrospinota bacterium]